MTASTRWRAWLVGVAIAAALLGGALLARMGPALSLALTLALPGAESWLAPLHAEVVVEEMSIEAGGRRLVADLYRPSAQSPSIGVAGLSFGAGPALLAAADVPDLALVASFGGYADLRAVILYPTTGIHQFRRRRYVQAPEAYNRLQRLALPVRFLRDPP